jgi:hypothetical protein
MKHKAKRGGYEEDVEKEKEKMMGGSKKKNGHRKDCKCPICKNMRNSKKRCGTKTNRRTRKRRGGNDEDDEDLDKKLDDETHSSSDEEEEEKREEKGEDKIEEKGEDKKGGKRRGNGHKVNCKCPICKNMRKKKGGNPDDEPDIENQKGDVEEAGIKATPGLDTQSSSGNISSGSESVANASEYDALDAAEKGEAGENVVGGTRKRRRCKKQSRRTRKSRRHRRH